MSTFDEWWEQVRAKPPYTPKEMSRAAWNAALANLPVFEQVNVTDSLRAQPDGGFIGTASETVVHILHQGMSLCVLLGHPNDWPPGHKWVIIDEARNATCSACREGLVQRQRI